VTGRQCALEGEHASPAGTVPILGAADEQQQQLQ
jgi:hypothetical protein